MLRSSVSTFDWKLFGFAKDLFEAFEIDYVELFRFSSSFD